MNSLSRTSPLTPAPSPAERLEKITSAVLDTSTPPWAGDGRSPHTGRGMMAPVSGSASPPKQGRARR